MKIVAPEESIRQVPVSSLKKVEMIPPYGVYLTCKVLNMFVNGANLIKKWHTIIEELKWVP